MQLQDTVVVVMGSGHGIGEGLARRFVHEGARAVVVSDLDEGSTRQVGEELGQPHRACDVGDAEQYAAFLDWVEDDVGPIDLLCNNPAIFGGPEGGNLQTTEETWERSWQVNVMAHVRSATQLVPRMLERGGGYFLQTLSAAALITSNSAAAYTVTKHAGLGFAEWLMLNYSDRGIKVSCICPTAVANATGRVRGHARDRSRPDARGDRGVHGPWARRRALPHLAEPGRRGLVPQEGRRLRRVARAHDGADPADQAARSVGLSPPDPLWLALDDAGRRFTLDEVRASCARFRPPRVNRIHEVVDPRPAATLVPVVDAGGEAAVLLTQRPSTMRYHRGDWVFPGGRVDVDRGESAPDAARREVQEELGIPAAQVEVVGVLDTHGPIVTGFVIEVFVGVIVGPFELAPDPREVAAVHALLLSSCMAPGSYSRNRPAPEHEPGPSARGATTVPAGDVGRGLSSFTLPDGELVWGTQGEILANLLEQLSGLRLADRGPGPRPVTS